MRRIGEEGFNFGCSGVRVGGPRHLPAWSPSSWCRGSPARLRVCLALGVVGGRPPAVLCCLPASSPGAPPASLSQWGPFTPALLWVHGQSGGSWLGGRIPGPRRSPPAVPPALGIGCLLQSRLLHLSPCLSAVQEVLAKKPLGKQM